MKPSREPYGKCACAFTDGFTLSFPASADALFAEAEKDARWRYARYKRMADMVW